MISILIHVRGRSHAPAKLLVDKQENYFECALKVCSISLIPPGPCFLRYLLFRFPNCFGLTTAIVSWPLKKTDRIKVNWNGSFSNRHTRIPEHAYWMHTSQHPDMNECIHPYVHTSNATCIYAYVYANMYILTYSRTRRWQKFQKAEYI